MNYWAYVHPAFQIATLSLGLVVLANGLRVRRSRKGGAGPETARIARLHMRLGRWFIAFFSAGYALGLGGMRFALEGPLYETAHSYFATLALGLFWTTAYLGRRLRKNLKTTTCGRFILIAGFWPFFSPCSSLFWGCAYSPSVLDSDRIRREPPLQEAGKFSMTLFPLAFLSSFPMIIMAGNQTFCPAQTFRVSCNPLARPTPKIQEIADDENSYRNYPSMEEELC